MWSQRTAAVVALVALGFMQASCTSRAPSVQAALDGPDLVLHQARFDRMVDGRVVALGLAPELSYWRAGGRFSASAVQVFLRPGPGTSALERFGLLDLQMPQVTGEVDEKRARATEGVHAKASTGEVAFAQVVVIDGPTDELRAPSGLRFTGEGQRLVAASATAPLDGSRVDLVTVSGRLERSLAPGSQGENAPVDYTAGKVSFDTQTKTIKLSEGVDFQSNDLHVTGERALVELSVQPQTSQKAKPRARTKASPSLPGLGGKAVQRFVVEGKVHVEKGPRTADGDRAVFEAKDQTLSLTGPSRGALAAKGPVLHEGNETLLGESVLWLLGSDEVEVALPRLSLSRSLSSKDVVPTRIEAKKLVLDRELRTLRFTGDVRLLREDLVARAPRMLANYDPGGEVETVQLSGVVKLTQGTRHGSSQTAVYEGHAHTVKLLGNPQLEDQGDVLFGEVIELFLDTKEVAVTKARGRLLPEGHKDVPAHGLRVQGKQPKGTP